jgi:hypothetical protein
VKQLIKWSAAVLLLFALLLVIAVWMLSPPPLVRDPPRDLPWELPDYRLASSSWEIGPRGKIVTRVEHFFLEGISPGMVSWFYQQLPIATIEYRGVSYPLYHIFHPSEHGTLRVVESAPDGTPGMARGALISRDEWFGPYDSRGTARIREFSNVGMLAIPEIAGMAIGEVRHSFTAENGGTRYRVDTIIGTDTPVLGSLLNLYLRKRVFHPQMIAQWQRHQIEEVASLQFFLPQLYAQRENAPHFSLTPSGH